MYTVIDVETTGNGLRGNKITEIAIFKTDGTVILEEFTSLVNPEQPIPYHITALTGIDDAMVANAPTFAEIAPQILEITKDTIFVAHAVNFDYGVIKEEFKQMNQDFVRKKLCTVRLSRRLTPGFNSYSLGKLCSSLSIPLTDRHRARGDAHATVLLFHLLLEKSEAPGVVTSFLNSKSQEATLPPHLNHAEVERIPAKPGIYIFYNQKREIIYVGKAKNLKKRVLGHFYDKSEHEIMLCRAVAHIDFELSGSEFLALLMESHRIKKHFPKFNRAQKRKDQQFAIFYYENRAGILQLGYNNLKLVAAPLVVMNNPTACRDLLYQLAEDFKLCPKYCQLRQGAAICKDIPISNCEGICAKQEAISAYNAKVKKAIAHLKATAEEAVIPLPGRHEEEQGFVFIEQGQYRGYGFIPKDQNISNTADLEAFLIPQQNTIEARQIINAFRNKVEFIPIAQLYV
ncbi:exonuclease domain-containing protein [Flavobacterium sp. ASW18X]|uniref:exonuclease domain-containing protein n=1 Tax=Flavobacterium sp. ASW18X TaxID=2572595 RepID=UPI0010AE213E|nr:exonuclease domain-containing protein [Flavobacterium sp. ASW18X]TKD61819.1 DNA polymerase III subunit epsilon [Flavobacterium sp. ASW18X]